MTKECEYKDCHNPIWSTGFCKWHQSKRTDDKWLRSLDKKKNKSGKKIFTITPRPYAGMNDLCVSGEAELYKAIWDSREHKSFLSGKPINLVEGSNFWFNVFAHVLAKGKAKYPKFKLYSKNIVMLTPEEHNLLDHCSSDEREKYAKRTGCDWNKIYNLAEELKEEYKEEYG